MARNDDWPKSPFRAATRPSTPVYFSTPIWRCQMPTLHKVADTMNVPMPDVVAFAAMAFIASFPTEADLMRALWDAHSRYAVGGMPVKLRFRMEWPDTPGSRCHAEHEQ